jgi:hypothetical protein
MSRTIELAYVRYNAILRETEKAWLVGFSDTLSWLPKSRCYLHIHHQWIGMPVWMVHERKLTKDLVRQEKSRVSQTDAAYKITTKHNMKIVKNTP